MKIKYNRELLGIMNIFSRATGATTRDCFIIDGTVYFIVEPGQMGRAIGKAGVTVRELQHRLQKQIQVIEFHPDVCDFVKNVLFPVRVDAVTSVDGIITIQAHDRVTKGMIIGRNAKHLNMLELAVSRYFPVKSVRIE